ncbi:MAG TPA: hypothetical protein VEA37_10160 [Flavobacterium sp.]|nr:hypothetical protein [Flavobacterium sp.]
MKDLTDLLDKLASELGTTAEYLWSVLIKQAPISATVTLIQIAILCVIGFYLYKAHKRFAQLDQNNDSMYDNQFYLGPVMMCVFLVWGFLIVVAFFSIDEIFYGYFNPEYWALQKILNTLNN